MVAGKQTDSLAEDARQGQEAFDQYVRPKLRSEDHGKFVAIDIQSGSYEIDADDYLATGRLLARLPAARIWLMRVGQATAYRMRRQACTSTLVYRPYLLRACPKSLVGFPCVFRASGQRLQLSFPVFLKTTSLC